MTHKIWRILSATRCLTFWSPVTGCLEVNDRVKKSGSRIDRTPAPGTPGRENGAAGFGEDGGVMEGGREGLKVRFLFLRLQGSL